MELPGLARLAAVALVAGACASPMPRPPASAGARTPDASPSVAAPSVVPTPSTQPVAFGPSEERYPDGVPILFDGRPVLRGAAALAEARGQAGTDRFLVGGWVTYRPGIRFCAVQIDHAWAHDCYQAQFSDVAGAVDAQLTDAITFRDVLDRGLDTGPVVAEVHVHDPRAGECGPARAECDAMMVVDRTAWSGDDRTAPAPLTAAAIADVLETLQGSRDVKPFGGDSVFTGCGASLPSAAIFTVASGQEMTPGVSLVQLEPSIDAMTHAAPRETVECESHSSLRGVLTESTDWRWLVVANSALLVRTHGEPTPKDRHFIARLGLLLGQRSASE